AQGGRIGCPSHRPAMAQSLKLALAAPLLVTPAPVLGKQPELPPNHLCCAARGPRWQDVYATLPTWWNHSKLEEVPCGAPDFDDRLLVFKEGASCSYCRCMYDYGEKLHLNPLCCSVDKFGTPHVDATTGLQSCQPYRSAYDLTSGMVTTCELRYDLYPWSGARASSAAAPAGAEVL
ncbi:unnamed protein product, partial [Prorocentrum cordatum]